MKTFADILADGVEKLRRWKRKQHRLDEWFWVQKIRMEEREALRRRGENPDDAAAQAHILCRIAERMPLSLPPGSALAGSQDAAFSPSYALIKPSFKVEEFCGYCDPTAIYDDIQPAQRAGLTTARIQKVRRYWEKTPYVQALKKIYRLSGAESEEVVYFMEPVTGHTIPDLRPFLAQGVVAMQAKARASKRPYGTIMANALEAVLILARRYQALAANRLQRAKIAGERSRLSAMIDALSRVPAQGARNIHEAVQAFVLLWQAMALEQAPNPYAFSVGNLDRILAPYLQPGQKARTEAVQWVRHLLCFFQVADRCWAISQNIMVAGRDEKGRDLSSPMTDIILDAFYATNDPQPALSVKVHRSTPKALYRSLGRFFFTPGHSTPSLFNDDSLFRVLRRQGVAQRDLPDYSIAGCQEPLIMGKSSLNTTNTWLNLAKVLELALNDGRSLLTNRKIGPSWRELGIHGGAETAYRRLEWVFYRMLDHFLPRMQKAGNACTSILGRERPVPLTSALMDGFHTWRDLRHPRRPGVKYHGSGCLIHGLSVVVDSLHAVQRVLAAGLWRADELRKALQGDFAGHESQRHFLRSQDKFGRGLAHIDLLARRTVRKVSRRIRRLRNPAGKPYLADWSTPSTHLLYGYWVGATPDGRQARSMLGYGVDPRPEAGPASFAERVASAWRLPFMEMNGGYASHIAFPPACGAGQSLEEKGEWFARAVLKPLFRLGEKNGEAPFYVYLNVDTAAHLRAVLRNPRRYAPNGIYILRIHGTFVNFLDLSPAIQEDIIARLEQGAAMP